MFLVFCMLGALPAQAETADLSGWVTENGVTCYYKKSTALKGYKKVQGYYYNFDRNSGAVLSGIYYVNGRYLYFRTSRKHYGAQITKSGWRKVSGKTYFLSRGGAVKEGWFKIRKKKYYQTVTTGILKGSQTIGGKLYYFSSGGVYSSKKTAFQRKAAAGATSQAAQGIDMGSAASLLFFTVFESGSTSYSQTGGDSGCACGRYQFDYRYALQPFLQYCYQKNPQFFASFEPFLSISKAKLKGNQKLYDAWKEVYNAGQAYFGALQDEFALESYYRSAERTLEARGIHVSQRPYVIRGAIFSYAIQEGSGVAADAVCAANITDATSNIDFLTALYDYRWNDPRGWNRLPVFLYRYTREKALALSLIA